MADSKISALTTRSLANLVPTTDVIPIVQSATNYKATTHDLVAKAMQDITGATTTEPGLKASISGDTFARFAAGINATDVPRIAAGSGSASRDAFIEYAGAANWRLGNADAAAPVAQTISVQNVVTGTANTAGAALRINGSRGTGTGAGGAIILGLAAASGSGNTPNALSDMYQFASTGQFSIVNNAGAIGIGSSSPDVWLRRVTGGFSLTTTATGTTTVNLNAAIINACSATATPASGSTSARLLLGTTAGFGIYYGSGAPTVSAAQGSIYLRSDGSGTSDRLYVNTNGTTGWTNFTSAA